MPEKASRPENELNREKIEEQEMKFAKFLSGSEKFLRDRALKKLKIWLTSRSKGSNEEDFMRIWVGLYYSMWMSDKMLVQEELAENLSLLVHCFEPNFELGLLFIKCFHKSINQGWPGLDQYRIDKFSMLIRRYLRQSLELCSRSGWNISVLKGLMEIYDEEVFKNAPLGVTLHFLDIFLEELAKVLNGKMNPQQFETIFTSIIKLMASTKDYRLRQGCEKILKTLINQTNAGLEYNEKFNAWKMAGCPGGTPDAMVKVEENGEEGEEEEKNKEEGEEKEEEYRMVEKDPRAGKVHVALPQIPVFSKLCLKILRETKISQNTTLRGKKSIINFIRHFQKLRKGKYPFALTEIPKSERIGRKLIDKYAKQLIKKTSVRKRNRKELKAKLKKLNQKLETEKSNSINSESPKKLKIFGEKENIFNSESKKKSPKKDEMPKKSPMKFHVESVPIDSPLKKAKKLAWEVDEVDEHAKEISSQKIAEENKRKADPFDEPLKEGETEIFIPSKKKVKMSPNPIFWDHVKTKVSSKRQSLTPTVAQEVAKPSSGRRISINLQKNRFQEANEYLEEVQKSPQVPFDGSKKPKQSALKPGLSPSPINPFYLARRKLM